jgi:hypothetical protein
VDSNPIEPESGSPISPNNTKRKGAKRELKSKNQQQFGKLRLIVVAVATGKHHLSLISDALLNYI